MGVCHEIVGKLIPQGFSQAVVVFIAFLDVVAGVGAGFNVK